MRRIQSSIPVHATLMTGDVVVTPDLPLDLITAEETCTVFGGGQSPIHISTLYRGVASGRFPLPYKIGPKTNRWSRAECTAEVRAIGAQRHQAI